MFKENNLLPAPGWAKAPAFAGNIFSGPACF